jgi:hypothetical protein
MRDDEPTRKRVGSSGGGCSHPLLGRACARPISGWSPRPSGGYTRLQSGAQPPPVTQQYYKVTQKQVLLNLKQRGGNIMFLNNCGKEVSDNAAICKDCGTPVQTPSNSWHFKNALVGIALWILSCILGTVIMAFFLISKSGQFDKNLIHKVSTIYGLFWMVVTYFIFYFISKRAQKNALKIK